LLHGFGNFRDDGVDVLRVWRRRGGSGSDGTGPFSLGLKDVGRKLHGIKELAGDFLVDAAGAESLGDVEDLKLERFESFMKRWTIVAVADPRSGSVSAAVVIAEVASAHGGRFAADAVVLDVLADGNNGRGFARG
jgi:hypothetical protein